MLKIILIICLCVVLPFVDAKIVRSSKTTDTFRKFNACPSTHKTTGPCPGWIMDHLWSLECGGKDIPENLWWQTEAESKVKDQQEKQCWRYYQGPKS